LFSCILPRRPTFFFSGANASLIFSLLLVSRVHVRLPHTKPFPPISPPRLYPWIFFLGRGSLFRVIVLSDFLSSSLYPPWWGPYLRSSSPPQADFRPRFSIIFQSGQNSLSWSSPFEDQPLALSAFFPLRFPHRCAWDTLSLSSFLDPSLLARFFAPHLLPFGTW